MLSYPYILFIDTETSEKPRSWEAPPTESDKWPYIVQIAWRIYDYEERLISAREFFIEAKDYSIKEKSRRIHGISEEMANARGVARKEALKALYKDLKRYKPLIVGHFVALDLIMVQAGFTRAGIKNIIPEYKAFCTMRATSDYMQMNDRNYPQLGELYQILFKKKMIREHNAAGDVQAVAECFFELVRRDEINDKIVALQAKEFQKNRTKKGKTGCGLPVLTFWLLIILLLWIW